MIPMSRRQWLQAGGAAGVLGIAGCSPAPAPPPASSPAPKAGPASAPPAAPPAPAVTLSPFDALRLIRESVRRSPDHLAVVARGLVARRDVQALHLFVRDRIRTLPDSETGLDNPVRVMRFGPRAALRAGAGTPREKAELLALLYREAGLGAEVMVGRVALAEDDPMRLFRGLATPAFLPSFAPGEAAALAAALGPLPAPAQEPMVDPDDAKAAALGAALTALSEENPGAQRPTPPRRSIEMPLVQVRTPTGALLSNPSWPAAALGEPPLIGRAVPAPPPVPMTKARITILATRASAPADRIELVSAEWGADELAGRQVVIGFAPPVSAQRLLTMRIGEVRTVVPMLALRGADLPEAEASRHTRTGRAITLGGDLIDIADDGSVRVNDEPMSGAEADSALVARVASLQVQARSAAFPTIQLAVTARDTAGAVVEGLPASAFAVEDGSPVTASLTRNRRAPRVLLLLDGSGSLPAAFRDRGAVAFAHGLAQRLLAQDPDLKLRVRAVGETPSAEPWLNDAAAVEASARRHMARAFDSGLWQAMARARSAADPTVVVLVTDGNASDQPLPEFVSRIGSGPPAVVIGVGRTNPRTLAALAQASGGETATVSDSQAAVEAIQRLLAARSAAAHRLSYRAPDDAAGERPVRVELAGRGVEARTRYTVPPLAGRAAPDALAGLYVGVQIGRDSVVRTLVEGAHDEVEAALWGTALLAFEGEAPTVSAWIDDVLSGLLAQEPLLRALKAGDREAAGAALANAPYAVVPEVFSFFPQWQRPADGQALSFATGLGAVLTTSRRRPGRPGVSRVDVLPTLRVATVGGTAESNTRQTLERTARLALTEQARYTRSTASLLAGKPLIVLPAGRTAGSVLKGVDKGLLGALSRVTDDPVWRSRVRFVAQDASTAAFWAVTPRNGTLIGVLPDGSGGGEVEDIKAVFDRASTILNNVGVAASAFGAGFGFGVWLSLEQTKLTKLSAATLTLATMEVQPGNIASPGELPCSIATGAIGPVLGAAGMAAAEKVVGWLGTVDAAMGAWRGGGLCSRL